MFQFLVRQLTAVGGNETFEKLKPLVIAQKQEVCAVKETVSGMSVSTSVALVVSCCSVKSCDMCS